MVADRKYKVSEKYTSHNYEILGEQGFLTLAGRANQSEFPLELMPLDLFLLLIHCSSLCSWILLL